MLKCFLKYHKVKNKPEIGEKKFVRISVQNIERTPAIQ